MAAMRTDTSTSKAHTSNSLGAIPVATEVLTTKAVKDGKAVRCIIHNLDGGWHFLDAESSTAPYKTRLGNILALDPALADLGDIPRGHRAIRVAPNAPWQHKAH